MYIGNSGDFTTTYIKALLLLPLAFYGIRLPKKENSPYLTLKQTVCVHKMLC